LPRSGRAGLGWAGPDYFTTGDWSGLGWLDSVTVHVFMPRATYSFGLPILHCEYLPLAATLLIYSIYLPLVTFLLECIGLI
jgi:hypothetical protein